MDSLRWVWRLAGFPASKTRIQWSGETQITFGGYALSKYLDHPVFQVIHSRYRDFGRFCQVQHETDLFGMPTDVVAGLSLAGGTTDAKRSVNAFGARAGRTADAEERAFTGETDAEARLHVTPAVSLILGGHYTNATRSLRDRFLSDGEDSAAAAIGSSVHASVCSGPR